MPVEADSQRLRSIGDLSQDAQSRRLSDEPHRHRIDLHHGADTPRGEVGDRIGDPREWINPDPANLASPLHGDRTS